MARIILTLVGPWDKPPAFETPFDLTPGGHDPSVIDDFRSLAGETEGLSEAELRAIADHRSTVVADLSFQGPGSTAAAGHAARLMQVAFDAGALGVRVETGIKVFGPGIRGELEPDEPKVLLHLLVEVLIDDEAVSTEGMQAFDLPDIVVPYGADDAESAQAVAFALAARMVCDGFRPVEGGVFRASESAPLYAVGRMGSASCDDPCPFENPNGAWRLDLKG